MLEFAHIGTLIIITALTICQLTLIDAQRAVYDATATSATSTRRTTNTSDQLAIKRAKAKEVLAYLNLTADPCHDFYDFACGNWAKNHKSNLQKDIIITPTHLLELRLNKDLQLLLENPSTMSADFSVRKVIEFYKSCKDVSSTAPAQQQFLMNFIKQHGGLPSVAGSNWKVENYNWLRTIAMLRANYSIEILIGMDIAKNQFTHRENTIYLKEPRTTLLPIELCSSVSTQMAQFHEKDYEQLQQEVCKNMQKWFSLTYSDANRLAGDIIRFEFDLCNKMRTEQTPMNYPQRLGQNRIHGERENSGFQRQSLQKFTQNFNKVIDFKSFVDTTFDTSINEQVYMNSEPYFRNLERALKNSNKLTLAHYIMYRAVKTLNLPAEDRPEKRAHYCVNLIRSYFPKVIGDMYQRHYQQAEAIYVLEEMFSKISKAFEQSLKNDWLSDNSWRAAKQKLLKIKATFPAYEAINLSDLEMVQSNFWKNLEHAMKYNAKKELDRLYNVNDHGLHGDSIEATDVQMKLNPMENNIRIGWGLMQAPFYNFYYAHSLWYSVLGQHLARELTMAFDEQSWHANTQSEMHWDLYTLQQFRNRSECFRKQYSNYLYNKPHIFRNASKLRELVAESSALRIAFNAYLAWLDSVLPINLDLLSKETLTGINFTNTQLFFINFAQARCTAKYDEKPVAESLPLDRHTNERYMVNGPLSNFVEFAREFGCKPGTEMNIDDKCVVY